MLGMHASSHAALLTGRRIVAFISAGAVVLGLSLVPAPALAKLNVVSYDGKPFVSIAIPTPGENGATFPPQSLPLAEVPGGMVVEYVAHVRKENPPYSDTTFVYVDRTFKITSACGQTREYSATKGYTFPSSQTTWIFYTPQIVPLDFCTGTATLDVTLRDGSDGTTTTSSTTFKVTNGTPKIDWSLLNTFGPDDRGLTGILSDPVDTASGAFESGHEDVPARGVSGLLAASRTYNSLDPAVGSLGQGWHLSLAPKLDVSSDSAAFFFGNGARRDFALENGNWTAAFGGTDTLQETGGGYRVTTADGAEWSFDSSGSPVSVVNRNGQGIQYTVQSGRVTKVAEGTRSIDLNYVGDQLASLTLDDGRHVDFGYTGDKLTSVTDLAGRTTQYAYDATGRLESETTPGGRRVFKNTYNSAGRVIDQEDARGLHSTFTYGLTDGDGDVVMTDPRGNSWTDRYENGYLIQRIDPEGGVWRYIRDDRLRMVAVIDPNGASTHYMYRNDDLAGTMNAEGGVSAMRYNGSHDLVESADFAGNRTIYNYDTSGNLLQQTSPTGAISRWTYNPNGTVATSTDQASGVTTYEYNADGNLTHSEDPEHQVTTYTYDTYGRLKSKVAPRGNRSGANPDDFRTAYTYDGAGNLATITNPLGQTSQMDYDQDDQLRTTTDPRGTVTTYAYDPAGHLTSQRIGASSNPPRTFSYDSNGNLATITDERGNADGATPASFTTTMQYDRTNRLTSVSNPASGATRFEYDARGLRKKITAPSGKYTTVTYNKLGLPTRVTYSDGTPEVSFGWNTAGQRTSMFDGLGYVSYTYDGDQRLVNAKRTYSSGTSPVTSDIWQATYDPRGMLASWTFPGQPTESFAYDGAGRLTSLKRGTGTSQATLAAIAYDPAAGTVTRTRQGGISETRTYDRAGRISNLNVTRAGQTLLSQAIGRDQNGNVTALQDNQSGPHTYRYDDANRLIGICDAASCPTADTISYGYDQVGNKIRETRASGTTNWTYDAANLMRTRIGALGAATFGYDPDGNRISDPQGTYEWNAAGRMAKSVSAGITTTYAYDGEGRRAWTGVPGSKNSINKSWTLWDPQSYLLAMERGNTGAVTRRYSYSQGLESMTAGSADYTMLTDVQGSVRSVFDATGTEQTRTIFEPFGRVVSNQVLTRRAPKVTLGFTGQLTDDSGMIHMRARQYDPTNAAFYSTDAGGSSSNMGYANGNPLTFADPFGTDPSATDWLSYIATGAGILAIGCSTVAIAVCGVAAPLLYGVSLAAGMLLTASELSACANGNKGACGQALLDIALTAIPGGRGVQGGISAGNRSLRHVDDLVCNCFLAGTKVRTADGRKSIEQIKVGDRVWARNLKTGANELRTVTGLFHKNANSLIKLRVSDGASVSVTKKHPFYVVGTGWVMSGQLRIGDVLAQRDGTTTTVTSIQPVPGSATVYNFAVQGDRNYFVSKAQLLVHNCRIRPPVPDLEGGSMQDVGGKIWGHSDPSALVGTRSQSELRDLASLGDAIKLRDFYQAAADGNFGGKAAPGRVQLAQEIIDAWNG